jgi:hypothetical protein
MECILNVFESGIDSPRGCPIVNGELSEEGDDVVH